MLCNVDIIAHEIDACTIEGSRLIDCARNLIEYYRYSEGCCDEPCYIPQIREFYKELCNYAKQHGEDKWDVFFSVLRCKELKFTDPDDRYYFPAFFKSCLRLGLISQKEYQVLSARYFAQYFRAMPSSLLTAPTTRTSRMNPRIG